MSPQRCRCIRKSYCRRVGRSVPERARIRVDCSGFQSLRTVQRAGHSRWQGIDDREVLILGQCRCIAPRVGIWIRNSSDERCDGRSGSQPGDQRRPAPRRRLRVASGTTRARATSPTTASRFGSTTIVLTISANRPCRSSSRSIMRAPFEGCEGRAGSTAPLIPVGIRVGPRSRSRSIGGSSAVSLPRDG